MGQNTKHANISFERSFRSGTEMFLKCPKMAFNGKTGKVDCLSFLGVSPGSCTCSAADAHVDWMQSFFCVSARLGCVKYSLERAFCTVSFPFIFLAFQALSPLWPIYPLNYMIFLLFISSLYWLVTASCQQSDNPSNELIMNTMLYSWNAYVAGN